MFYNPAKFQVQEALVFKKLDWVGSFTYAL